MRRIVVMLRSSPCPCSLRSPAAFSLASAFWFVITTGFVWLSAYCGASCARSPELKLAPPVLIGALSRWDGAWYAGIVRRGYADIREPPRQPPPTAAFFPLYPLLARSLVALTGARAELALLVVSYVSLLAAFILFGRYAVSRYVDQSDNQALYALLAFALFPMTFFWRMAYTESLFVCLAVLALHGMHQRWPLPWIAAIAGCATAARPTGVALIPPLLLCIVHRSPSAGAALRKMAYLLPLACAGLFGYMIYQWLELADPLAFVKAQRNFGFRVRVPWDEKILILLSWEPIWSVFVPSSRAYWGEWYEMSPWLNLPLANTVCFVAAAVLVGIGAHRRWLSSYEVLLSAGLLLIPYVTRSYEMCMHSHGRFAGVVFPMYIVMGHLLARAPKFVAIAFFWTCAFYLGIYSAMFAAGYILR